MDGDELAWIAKATGATSARRADRIQSLWSGYGEIVRVRLTGARGAGEREDHTVIVKSVKPPARVRGKSAAKADDASHARKCRSYDVEMAWYRSFASQCDGACRVPRFLGGRSGGGEWLFVLEDLDSTHAGFPERRRRCTSAELDVCLAWLAAFHARFLGVAPEGLWKTGTYWHLATRTDELAAIEDPELRAAAPILDRQLREAAFKTFVHGDAKLANFCFAPGGRAVAAVDFQYVGGGSGVKDVAYLLYGESSSAAVEQRHLDTYFRHLREDVAKLHPAIDVAALESEWRALYPIAAADFRRFLAGWRG
jgi:hypothetical protein